jgi:hypothetical protein
MFMTILIGVAVIFLLFLAYVLSRPNSFHYERSGLINAPVDKIYPYLINFKLGSQWSPYEKIDLNMKKTFSGPDSGVGAKMEFDGNNKVGAGKLEILKVVPHSRVELRLEMIRPIGGVNLIHYKLVPESAGTRFTWMMEGKANFLSKLVGVLIDCDKMIGNQFNEGIQNLKKIAESI